MERSAARLGPWKELEEAQEAIDRRRLAEPIEALYDKCKARLYGHVHEQEEEQKEEDQDRRALVRSLADFIQAADALRGEYDSHESGTEKEKEDEGRGRRDEGATATLRKAIETMKLTSSSGSSSSPGLAKKEKTKVKA